MSRNRFVSAQRPRDHADELHEVQRRLAALETEVKELKAKERHLQAYLIRVGQGKSFTFNSSDGFVKKAEISHHSRLILDQDRAKRMLKTRTPYTTSEWDRVKIDWIYE